MNEVKRIDMAELLAQHRKRYTVETGIGTITLKHPSRADWSRVTNELSDKNPNFELVQNRLVFYADQLKIPGRELSLPELEEYKTLMREQDGYLDHYFMACFVDPVLADMEQLLALAHSLTEQEWVQLQDIVVSLIQHRDVPSADLALVSMCKEYGIPFTNDLTMENLTEQQYFTIVLANEKEQRDMKQVMDGM